MTAEPIETADQARRHPAVELAHGLARETTRRGVLAEQSHKILCSALSEAGVEVGFYDHRIITWLAGYEPETCAVIASLITRAAAAEQARILALIDSYVCPDCDGPSVVEALAGLAALITEARHG